MERLTRLASGAREGVAAVARALDGAAAGAGRPTARPPPSAPPAPRERRAEAVPAAAGAQAGAPPPPGPPPGERAAALLSCERVDVRALAEASRGYGASSATRAAAWKLLLGYLPPRAAEWAAEEAARRAEYARFVEEVVDPRLFQQEGAGAGGGGGVGGGGGSGGGGGAGGSFDLAREAAEDDPLSQAASSSWKRYFEDGEVLEQIVRDVERTHPDIHFFSGLTADGEGGAGASGGGDMGALTATQRSCARALFVYAKLNPGIRYVQGMNELFAPLFYVFRTAPSCARDTDAEADAFFCFSMLMGEFRDNYCEQLDNSEVGVKATLTRLERALDAADPMLHAHLNDTHGVASQLYAFRWVTLLLTQEFPLPDALSLWDVLMAERRDRLGCLLRMCVAMLLEVRETLLQGDFAACLKLLQRYPPCDVARILARAETLHAV